MSRRIRYVDDDYTRVFAENIRAIRKYYRWSQEVLAEQAELHPSYISQIERQKARISIKVIESISLALDVAPSILLTPEGYERIVSR